MQTDKLIAQWREMTPMQWAEHAYGWIGDDGQPIALAEWQRVVLAEYWARRHAVSTLFVSTTKKAGKTLLDSLLTCYRWLTMPHVHFVVGNDQDQSAELQINMIAAMVKRHPVLASCCKLNRAEIVFEPTGSRIVSLPMDAPGAAGANFATASFTELWGFVYEQNERLYDELTPIPGATPYDCLRIVDSYAGFVDESELLRRVWDRGLAGERISEQWPIYLTGQQLSYIHQGDDAQRRCWRFSEAARLAYYVEQQETLRANSYRRLHRNEWASSEDKFISPEQWDALILEGYHAPGPDKAVHLVAGVDLAVKHDYAAVVTVWPNDGLLYLGPYRIFVPAPEVDIGAVEHYIEELAAKYSLDRANADPYQMAGSIQRLQRKGIRIAEYPQTVSNMTLAGNSLFDCIREGRLVVYAGADSLREHVLNAHAKETSRGIRLIKEASSRKIDAAIALAMAVADAESAPVMGAIEVTENPFYRETIHTGDPEWHEGRAVYRDVGYHAPGYYAAMQRRKGRQPVQRPDGSIWTRDGTTCIRPAQRAPSHKE